MHAGPVGMPAAHGDREFGDRVFGDRVFGDRVFGDRVFGDRGIARGEDSRVRHRAISCPGHPPPRLR